LLLNRGFRSSADLKVTLFSHRRLHCQTHDFLGDYWQVYKRSGFAAARVEIYRFDVQVTQSTRELVGNKRALMADIRGA
jgi:hypothetical protein